MPDKLVMRSALLIAAEVWEDHGQELVITSGMEGEHSAGSLHYYGYAFDARTRYWEYPEDQLAVFRVLQERLGEGFQAVWHSTHIHVEYQKILGDI